MADARQRSDWQHTSALMCLLANLNRDPKKTGAFKPSDFDPFAKAAGSKTGIPITKKNLKLLKKVFVKEPKRKRRRKRKE